MSSWPKGSLSAERDTPDGAAKALAFFQREEEKLQTFLEALGFDLDELRAEARAMKAETK